ncbi:hypothetical protein LINGRAHAP2_LOCUS36756 [Linum grandiflorum]
MATTGDQSGGLSRGNISPTVGPTSQSFKETLVGSRSETRVTWNDFSIDEDVQKRIKITFADGNRLKPRIEFDEDLEEELSFSWRFSLVVKVYGWTVGYFYPTNKLARLWKPMGEWKVLDVGNGFFVLKFQDEEDMIEAFAGGPL